jgi:hypothetical protein
MRVELSMCTLKKTISDSFFFLVDVVIELV